MLTMEVDDEGGLSVRGPKIAGRAKTDEAPQWFGNCLETMVIKNEKEQRIYVNPDQYFEGVSKDVWDFVIGSYQVCEKWLKEHKKAGRSLSTGAVDH